MHYLGPYIKVEGFPMVEAIRVVRMCNTCNTERNTKFCQSCGSATQENRYITLRRPDVISDWFGDDESLYEAHLADLNGNQVTEMPDGEPVMVLIPNVGSFNKVDMALFYEITDRVIREGIAELKSTFREQIQILQSMNVRMEIRYGLVTYNYF